MQFNKFPNNTTYFSSKLDGDLDLHKSPKNNSINNRNDIVQTINSTLDKLVAMQQIHSSNIKIIESTDAGSGATNFDTGIENTDGMITNNKDVTLLALGADCVLVAFYDPIQEIVGVAHSGWRGTAAGICLKMLERMEKEFGSNSNDVIIGISPAAQSCCYQVGSEVQSTFEAQKWNFNMLDSFKQRRDGLYLKLPKLIEDQLVSAGVLPVHIDINMDCTICNPAYFSYRKEQLKAGRQGLFVQLP